MYTHTHTFAHVQTGKTFFYTPDECQWMADEWEAEQREKQNRRAKKKLRDEY